MQSMDDGFGAVHRKKLRFLVGVVPAVQALKQVRCRTTNSREATDFSSLFHRSCIQSACRGCSFPHFLAGILGWFFSSPDNMLMLLLTPAKTLGEYPTKFEKKNWQKKELSFPNDRQIVRGDKLPPSYVLERSCNFGGNFGLHTP